MARRSLMAFSRRLNALRGQKEVIRLVLATVTSTLGAREASLWLRDGECYRLAGSKEPESLSGHGPLISWLRQERRPLLALPDDPSPQAQELRQREGVLAIPLWSGKDLTAVLVLGERLSGGLYTGEDLELLSALAPSASLALENARLHEERVAILRQQLARVTEAQEEERQRIAQELHDGIGPTLASLNVRLHTARKRLERDRHPAAEEIAELAALAQANIQEIRRMIYDLRPAVLDELGLVPALHQYLSRCQEEHGLAVTLHAEGVGRLPPSVETALFRIAQEAVANVVRHAQAARVDVTLARRTGGVILCVADDGRGFIPEAPRDGTHLGLWSMEERVRQLGGHFEMRSAPGEGTEVWVAIPVAD